MTTYLEGRHPGEFLMTEANGQRSRQAIILRSGQNPNLGRIDDPEII